MPNTGFEGGASAPSTGTEAGATHKTGSEAASSARTGNEAAASHNVYSGVDMYWDEYLDTYGADAGAVNESGATHRTGFEGGS